MTTFRLLAWELSEAPISGNISTAVNALTALNMGFGFQSSNVCAEGAVVVCQPEAGRTGG